MSTPSTQPGTSPSEFDRAIAVRPRDPEPGVYDADLDPGWQIGAGINGGVLLAVCGNALRETFHGDGHDTPMSITGYYLSASAAGPATVHARSLRRGRTMSTGSVSLVQADPAGREVERVRGLATYGDLDALPGEVRTSAVPPDLPPVEECVSHDLAPGVFSDQATLLKRIDLRMDPHCVGWAMGKPSGRGVLRSWFRLADGREPDPLMLLLAVDVLPPVAFDYGETGWAPTLELTAHVRARPAPGWLRVVASTRNYAGGLFEEDCEVWDSADRLVAQSRQLARAPRAAADH